MASFEEIFEIGGPVLLDGLSSAGEEVGSGEVFDVLDFNGSHMLRGSGTTFLGTPSVLIVRMPAHMMTFNVSCYGVQNNLHHRYVDTRS